MVPMLVIGSLTLGSLWALARSSDTTTDAADGGAAQDAVGRAVRADATGVAREVEELVAERVTDVVDWAAAPAIRGAARTAAVSGGGDALAARPTDEIEAQYADQRRLRPGSGVERYLRSATERVPGFGQLMLTERNGLVVGAANRPGSIVQRNRNAWSRAWEDGLFIGEVARLGGRNAHGMVIAARVQSPQSGERFGVLLATLHLTALQDEVDRIAADGDAAITLLSGDGELLAETGSGHRGSRIMSPDVEMAEGRAAVVDAALDAGAPGFRRSGETLAGFAPLATVDGGLDQALSPYDDVDSGGLDWTALVEQPVDAAPATADAARGDIDRALGRFAVIVGVILLLALAAAAFVSTRLARDIVAPLRRLSSAARDVAEARLPALVAQVQAQRPDAETPQLPSLELQTDDEIAEVAEAFNSVGQTAAGLATDQARSRRNVARMFVSLGRRNQSLLSRQLEYIDRLEREESDADALEHLFQLDHLATRMRRNAESLLVLAGEEPPRRWSEPVPLSDVVRGAVGEIEDYQRVSLEGLEEVGLAGRAVGDVSHLLAELIENATNFSPPDSTVAVTGRLVDEGYSLSVTDHGVGMTSEQFEDANQRIDTSPRVDRVPASYLGLFVVGRLAARHGIRVRLVESEGEGVTAKVLLPAAIVQEQPAGPSRTDDAVPAAEASAEAGGEARPVDDGTAVADGGRHEPVWVDVTDRADDADEPRVPEPATVGAGTVARSDRRADGPTTDDAEWPRLPRVGGRRGGAGDGDDEGRRGGGGEEDRGGGSLSEIDVRDEVVGPLETTDELTPVQQALHDDQPDDEVSADASAVDVTADDAAVGDDAAGDAPDGDAVDRVDDTPADHGPDADVPTDDGGRDREAPDAAASEAPAPTGGPPPQLAVRRRRSKRDPDANGRSPRNGDGRDATGRVVIRPEAAEVPAVAEPHRAAAADAGSPAVADAGRPAVGTTDGGGLADADTSDPPATTDEDGVMLTDTERRARLARQRLATFQRAVRHGRAQTARHHDPGARDG